MKIKKIKSVINSIVKIQEFMDYTFNESAMIILV